MTDILKGIVGRGDIGKGMRELAIVILLSRIPDITRNIIYNFSVNNKSTIKIQVPK